MRGMIEVGIFELKTPQQLFAKPLKDYAKVRQQADDSEGWFNFIVTADHLPEWEAGAKSADLKKAAKMAGELRESEAMLRVVHYLCINGKYFRTWQEERVMSTNATSSTTIHSDGTLTHRSPKPQREFYLELPPEEAADLGRMNLGA